jgi:WD40-like Beta Propeller Repeat
MGILRARGGRTAARWWTAGVAGLASLALLGTGLAGTAQASYPGGSNGLIAFVRDGNIWTIQPNGTDWHRLTSGGHDSGPRWSPNGEKIAYLYRGNLWIMGLAGGSKKQITSAAPTYTDARPSWSPNGRYLAFVKTKQGMKYGYLTRYDTVTHKFVTFSTPYHSEQPTRRQIKVTARPAPVAWGWAMTGSQFGSFILFEAFGVGAAKDLCQPNLYCLDALGRPHQNMYRNSFPSAEDQTPMPTRIADPDWFPITPQFGTDVLTSQENCTSNSHCTPSGIDLGIGSSPVIPGAYDAVYSPTGRAIAYVQDAGGAPEIYLALNVASPAGTLLTAGSQPDWQPIAAAR